MCTPHGKAPNLLTSPADSKWRAVRKTVAVSFSANNIRKKFPVWRLKQRGGGRSKGMEVEAKGWRLKQRDGGRSKGRSTEKKDER
jgi:hypothetical protein